MTISPQSLALFIFLAFAFGMLVGGICVLSIAMRALKQDEGVGYDR